MRIIEEWQKVVAINEKDKGFDDNNLDRRLILIVDEISEAHEELRAGHAPDEIYFNPEKPDKPEGFGIELADAVIRIMGTCQKFGIDLDYCLTVKHEYNLTRPFKHGKQF